MAYPRSHSQEGAEPRFPVSGAYTSSTDVEDIATNLTIALQSLIYNSEIQKILKTGNKIS